MEIEQICALLDKEKRDYVVIAVDDGSTDGSTDMVKGLCKKKNVELVVHQRNLGLGVAMKSGIKRAAEFPDLDIIITKDADLTQDIEIILPMIESIQNQGYDIAIASRYLVGCFQEKLGLIRNILTVAGNRLFRYFIRYGNITDYTCNYRAYKGSLILRLKAIYGDDFITERDFSCIVEILLRLLGFEPRVCEIPLYLKYGKKIGKSKMRIIRDSYNNLKLLFEYMVRVKRFKAKMGPSAFVIGNKTAPEKISVNGKRLGTIQVDVDSFWAIAENAGVSASKNAACGIYELAIPRFLELFRQFDIRATFFVIGKDLLNRKNIEILQEALRQGHEVANHTMNHITDRAFSSLPLEKRIEEIKLSHNAIFENIGVKPVGFKAPAYSLVSEEVLKVLDEEGYLYDSSAMPVSVAGALNMMQHIIPHMTKRSYWQNSGIPQKVGNVLQVPVSTIPRLNLPFSSSFVFVLGFNWFRLGYLIKKSDKAVLNYTFHAVDMVGKEEMDDGFLKLFGLNYGIDEKKRICRNIASKIAQDYKLVPTKEMIGHL